MKIAIRLDDITPDMDWEKFDRFKALMDKYGVKPLIGVIPDNRDSKLSVGPEKNDFWEHVLKIQQQGWMIAMHGLYHVYTTQNGGLFPLNHKSEFAGLPYEQQSAMIAEGRAILERHGIATDIFMAPSHTYDENTLKALKANGFYRITDGFGYGPYTWQDMTFYPLAMQREKAVRMKREGAVTLVVHPATLTDRDFAWYEHVFQTASMIAFPEYVYYPASHRGFAGHLVEKSLAALKYKLVHRNDKKG